MDRRGKETPHPRGLLLPARFPAVFLLLPPHAGLVGCSCLLPRDALDALHRHLARLQADIACKANSMLLDTKCMDTRRKLTVPAEKFVPEVDTFNRTTNRTLSPLKSCQLQLA